MRVADYVVRGVNDLGVEYAFGMNGANIEDIFEASHRAGGARAIVAKHEYSAVAMAHGYHLKSGKMGVVLTTSGAGAFNIVSALAEALTSRVPLLAIVGQVPQVLEGRGGFQDSSGIEGTPDAQKIFASVSVSCRRVKSADEIPHAMERCVIAALEKRGPSVLLLPKDVQQAEGPLNWHGSVPRFEETPGRAEEWDGWSELRDLLDKAILPPLAILGEELIAEGVAEEARILVEKLDAMVAVTPAAKGLYDHRSFRFLGVTGVMGHPSVEAYLREAELGFLVGTRLPLLARYGLESTLAAKSLVIINDRPCFVEAPANGGAGARQPARLVVPGPLSRRLSEINDRLGEGRSFSHDPARRKLEYLEIPPATEPSDTAGLSYRDAVSTIGSFLEDDCDVFVDAGNTGAALVHYLNVRGKAIFFVALGMGGMGYCFGAAIGSTVHTRKRTYVFAGDGAFYMHGLELHTAVEHDLPLVAVVFNNNGHAMCEMRDRLYLGGARGENVFKRALIGRGLGAMFPSILSREARDTATLVRAMREIECHRGPAFLSVDIDSREVPPFAPFLDRLVAEGRMRTCAPMRTS
jgi:acetolactate synthase I/II/III large subunit